jgi:sterol 3beta-glucosyltransferase
MKAILFSIGTRGDIEPFLAVAELLKDRDWDVICVFPEQFRKPVEEMGIVFKGFSSEFLEILDGKDAKIFIGGRASFFTRFTILIKMAKKGIRLSKDIIALQHRIQIEENPDKIIYHPKCNFNIVWGMANPGKSIMISPIPGMAHSIDHFTLLGGNYGRVLNRLSYWILNTIKALVIQKVSKPFWKDYRGLKVTVSSVKKAMLEKEYVMI